ncbi:MaoC/PaaZ C-terminal domain-containing protein [Actinosynnema mirum]|uniref:MaoC domain protein dehydratase n=1 Tax=Actinosynnema mirum (strain ATCC 29888 / DSM 43827 / JCM 3225 / NBRC 14064 / NCIMB 13271 / NRRL B-12336 / IMRU 3971 / 101) TaxID=446462 RepID=C6WPH5_ACTMD|nr:MaoC/PaaZ C-terminal domain-containing protein [Actinosynnema mirum]ACU38677.1 MaoC domain protein dehydratase [Actinosynnema mirum DSM 43827]
MRSAGHDEDDRKTGEGRHVVGLAEVARWFQDNEGTDLGFGPWHEVAAPDVAAFADVTRDWQRIHFDTAEAAEGPYGGPVVHGFLVLALIPHLTSGLLDLRWTSLGVNYRLDRVRFPAPVRVGERVRARAWLGRARTRPRGYLELVLPVEVWAESATRAACTAEHTRLYRVAEDAELPDPARRGAVLDPRPEPGTEPTTTTGGAR